MFSVADGASVAVVRPSLWCTRGALQTPDASSPVVWVVGSVPGRTVCCNLPLQKQRQSCKARYRASRLCRVREEVAQHVENMQESRKRDTKNPNRSENWRFDIAMSIPFSENENCHEDQLDPCDCRRRQPWEGARRGGYQGGGGGRAGIRSGFGRPPPLPPPQWFLPTPPPPLWCGVVVGCFPPPRGVLWCGVVWCGVVWLWVASPLPVVWCGSGVGFGGLWRGVGWVVPPCMFGSAWGVWQTHAHDDIDDDDDDDNHDHHYHNHLSVSLVGRRVSSAHVPADDYRFIDRGARSL